MKLRHIVLFGIVASIMTYLNSTLEDEKSADTQENILNELKELIDNKLDDIDIEKKLEEIKEKAPEQLKAATETVRDVTDNLIDELNSIVGTLEDIAASAIDDLTSDDEDNAEAKEEPENEMLNQELEIEPSEEELEDMISEEEKPEDIISEIESLLASLDEEPSKITENPECEEIKEDETPSEEPAIEEPLEEETVPEAEEGEDEPKTDEFADFDEDDYLEKIREAINSTIALDENGDAVDMSGALDEEDDRREITQDEIDEIFSEILRQEGLEEEKEIEEAPLKTDEEEYLDDLKEDLEEELEGKEEEVGIEEPEADIYAQINELYPYLSRGFVRAVYDLKESIANEYPLGQRIVILHRLSFKDLEHLRQFSEIVLNHDYRVNVDENKMIVDIFKDMINSDGKILTNIFEIANQARLLEGNYEGYRVEVL